MQHSHGHQAIENNHFEIIELLLLYFVDLVTPNRCAPLVTAVYRTQCYVCRVRNSFSLFRSNILWIARRGFVYSPTTSTHTRCSLRMTPLRLAQRKGFIDISTLIKSRCYCHCLLRRTLPIMLVIFERASRCVLLQCTQLLRSGSSSSSFISCTMTSTPFNELSRAGDCTRFVFCVGCGSCKTRGKKKTKNLVTIHSRLFLRLIFSVFLTFVVPGCRRPTM